MCGRFNGWRSNQRGVLCPRPPPRDWLSSAANQRAAGHSFRLIAHPMAASAKRHSCLGHRSYITVRSAGSPGMKLWLTPWRLYNIGPIVADSDADVSGFIHGYICVLQPTPDRATVSPDSAFTRSSSHPTAIVATYDSYPYNRMASMGYPPPPMPPSSASRVQPGGKLGLLPYSVNGVSLTSPGANLLHPAMGYQGTDVFLGMYKSPRVV